MLNTTTKARLDLVLKDMPRVEIGGYDLE